MKSVDIRKAGAVLLRDGKFLVVRSYGKDIFVAPGGKLETGETEEQALIRELKEEIQIHISEESLEELGVYYAVAAGQEDKRLEMTVFIVSGGYSEPTPSAEIEEIKWIDSTTQENVGSIFMHDVMPELKARGLIA